jgi:hypothetical protein
MFGEKLLFVTSIPRKFTVDACGEANMKMLVTLQQTPREFRDEVFYSNIGHININKTVLFFPKFCFVILV